MGFVFLRGDVNFFFFWYCFYFRIRIFISGVSYFVEFFQATCLLSEMFTVFRVGANAWQGWGISFLYLVPATAASSPGLLVGNGLVLSSDLVNVTRTNFSVVSAYQGLIGQWRGSQTGS